LELIEGTFNCKTYGDFCTGLVNVSKLNYTVSKYEKSKQRIRLVRLAEQTGNDDVCFRFSAACFTCDLVRFQKRRYHIRKTCFSLLYWL